MAPHDTLIPHFVAEARKGGHGYTGPRRVTTPDARVQSDVERDGKTAREGFPLVPSPHLRRPLDPDSTFSSGVIGPGEKAGWGQGANGPAPPPPVQCVSPKASITSAMFL